MFKNREDSPHIITGLAWCPSSKNLEAHMSQIRTAKNLSGLIFEKLNIEGLNLTRPTSFQTNDFIQIFQLIVDTYGTPNYKEFNPAVPAIVSFPFLNGIMFGDVMHGAILTGFGIYLCMSKREKGSLAHTLSIARYLILMNGLFSTYCGLIYNDFTSLPVMLTGSCWKEPPEKVQLAAK